MNANKIISNQSVLWHLRYTSASLAVRPLLNVMISPIRFFDNLLSSVAIFAQTIAEVYVPYVCFSILLVAFILPYLMTHEIKDVHPHHRTIIIFKTPHKKYNHNKTSPKTNTNKSYRGQLSYRGTLNMKGRSRRGLSVYNNYCQTSIALKNADKSTRMHTQELKRTHLHKTHTDIHTRTQIKISNTMRRVRIYLYTHTNKMFIRVIKACYTHAF